MDTDVELNGTVYRRIGEDWYDAATFIRAPQIVARELDARFRASGTTPLPSGKPKSSTIADGDEDSSFRHAEAFPIIADVIRECSQQEGNFIHHHEIVAAFLAHPEGRTLAQEAAEKQDSSVDWAASNMVAWFSKRFTEGETPYQDEFERKRVEGRWAYRKTSMNNLL